MRGRRFAGAGLMRRGGREPAGGGLVFGAWIGQTAAGLNAIEGGSALHAWVPEFAVTTFNGSNVSAIKDQWGAADMAQGTAANQPPWLATGGPHGRPTINLGSTTSRFLTATLPGYAAGNRVCIYAVTKQALGDGAQAYLDTPADAIGFYTGAANFALFVDYDVGASFNAEFSAPTFDTNWHIHALRPLASGSLSQIDGANTTDNPVGDGLVEINRAIIGSQYALFCGGRVAGLFLVNNATAAKDTYLRNRLAAWFGAFPQ